MRKTCRTIASIRDSVESLKGVAVDMRVDCGRKRIVTKQGTVESTYPSVFTVVLKANNDVVSFSYTDILCGTLLLTPIE